MHFDNVRLLVNDYQTMFSFYQDVLGLKLAWGTKEGNFASFDHWEGKKHAPLAIFRRELMPAELSSRPRSETKGHVDLAMLVFEVKDVDSFCQKLTSKGCKLALAPRDMPDWGIRVAHLRDPEGNLLEFVTDLPKGKWSEHLLSQMQS